VKRDVLYAKVVCYRATTGCPYTIMIIDGNIRTITPALFFLPNEWLYANRRLALDRMKVYEGWATIGCPCTTNLLPNQYKNDGK
jgi:hypothetical protein